MTKTCFPEDLGGACLRASAEIGTNRGALSHLAIVVQKLTHFIILGLAGLLADQQLGFGHRSACKRKSFVQFHEPCSCMGCVWMRCLPSCTEEVGETRSYSCRRF